MHSIPSTHSEYVRYLSVGLGTYSGRLKLDKQKQIKYTLISENENCSKKKNQKPWHSEKMAVQEVSFECN